jgi:hypothetical protein
MSDDTDSPWGKKLGEAVRRAMRGDESYEGIDVQSMSDAAECFPEDSPERARLTAALDKRFSEIRELSRRHGYL